MKPKAIFFDLDHTLVDSEQCHEDSTERSFAARGISYEDVLQKTKDEDYLGTRVVDALKIMRDAVGVSEQEWPLHQLTQQREQIFLELVAAQACLLPGATKALRYAKEKVGQVVIVSSGTRTYIQQCIEQFAWQGLIDFYVGEEDVARGKPNPDCFLEAWKRLSPALQANVEECVVVEDSPNGVKAGQAAGMPVIWVPFFDHLKKIDLPATYKLNSLLEFPALLNQLNVI